MPKLIACILGGLAALAATPAGAAPEMKTLTVPLADGSTVTVHYVGDVPPKVTIAPAVRAHWRRPAWVFPRIPDLRSMIADLDRRREEMERRMRSHSARPLLKGRRGMTLASDGAAAPNAASVSVISISNGGRTCTRTTRVVAEGAGNPPRVTSRVSGDCDPDGGGAGRPAAVSHS